MNELWFRVDADAGDDPKVGRLADALGCDVVKAYGHMARVWGGMAHHADEKLSDIADATLEQWALWSGKRGKFAKAFRLTCQAEDGALAGWWRQAHLVEFMKKDRERKRRERAAKASPASTDGPRTNGGLSTDGPDENRGQSMDSSVPYTRARADNNKQTETVTKSLLMDDTRAIVGAINLGHADNPAIDQKRRQVIPLQQPASQQAVADILAAGVPAEFAKALAYGAAKEFKPTPESSQIGSAAFLVQRITRAWRKREAELAVANGERPAPPPESGEDDFITLARRKKAASNG